MREAGSPSSHTPALDTRPRPAHNHADEQGTNHAPSHRCWRSSHTAYVSSHAKTQKAQAAARAWQHQDRLKELEQLDKDSSAVIVRSQVEQWTVNASIRYDRWSQLDRQDFGPVVDSFKQLFELFRCGACDGVLSAATRGIEPVAIKCGCGATSWNLSSP